MTETKEVTKTDPAVARMQDMLKQYKGHMAALLGKHMSVEQMFQVALLAVGRVPKLRDCTTATVLGCILESARLGLQAGAGAGETWLIPRKNRHTNQMECTLIVDYRAIIKMMKRDAGVKTVLAEAVYANDDFAYGWDPKTGPFVRWNMAKGNRGAVVGYVSASWDKDAACTGVIYMTKDEIDEKIKKKAMAADSGPWKTDPDWMYKKSVIRPLGKLNPGTRTEGLQRAIALDERADLGLPQNLHLLADPTATPELEAETGKTYDKPTAKAAPKSEQVPADPKSEPDPEAPAATKEEADEREFLVESVAKTTLGKQNVSVVRPKGAKDGEKFYVENDALADFCREAMKDGFKVRGVLFADSHRTWLQEARKA